MPATPPRNVTLKQVASHAGVHLSTVSRALDPERRHLISGDIVARVQSAARELGWRPNSAAAALRKGRSMAIGVLVPDMVNLVTAQIMQGIEAAIVARGFFPLVVSMRAAESGRAVIERLLAQRVDGVILTTELDDPGLLQMLLRAGIAAVTTTRAEAASPISAVVGDRAAATQLVIEHLHALGHRRIALLAGPQNGPRGVERLQFALAALHRFGLEPSCIAICDDFTRDAGLRACEALLAQRAAGVQDFTAISAANDLVALGAYEAIRRRGLTIPRDVSVIGQNDTLLADMVSPPLTTVRLQHDRIGQQAGDLVIDEIEARSRADAAPPPPRVISFRPELVVRDSTAAPAR